MRFTAVVVGDESQSGPRRSHVWPTGRPPTRSAGQPVDRGFVDLDAGTRGVAEDVPAVGDVLVDVDAEGLTEVLDLRGQVIRHRGNGMRDDVREPDRADRQVPRVG
ncbi:MAG: hypothetical protein V4737_16565, partial [Curtobacterium sp.]